MTGLDPWKVLGMLIVVAGAVTTGACGALLWAYR